MNKSEIYVNLPETLKTAKGRLESFLYNESLV